MATFSALFRLVQLKAQLLVGVSGCAGVVGGAAGHGGRQQQRGGRGGEEPMKFHKMMHPFLFKILIISAGTSGKEGPARPSTAKSGRRRLSQPLPPKGTGGPPPLRPADGPPSDRPHQIPLQGHRRLLPHQGADPVGPGDRIPPGSGLSPRPDTETAGTADRPAASPTAGTGRRRRGASRLPPAAGSCPPSPAAGPLPREQPHPAGLVPLAPAAGMAANLPAVGGKGRPVLQQVPGLFHRTAHSQTDTSMEEIITSSTGMSFRPVFTAAMASTTTMPSYTWPNTV